jgi:hypothetical protein
MQSGKTLTAEYLVHKYGFRLHKFAGPLKGMLAELFRSLGINAQRALEGDLKETPLAALGGKTPRFALQSLGTEWGRNMVDEDLWVRIAMKQIELSTALNFNVVVDDMRLPNEYAALAALPNSILVKIVRPGETPYAAHGSEGLLENFTFDYTIINNKTPEDLYIALGEVMYLGHAHGARATGQKEIIIEPK